MLTLFANVVLGSGCSHNSSPDIGDTSRFDSLFRKASDAARKDDFDTCDSLGLVLYKEAHNAGDKVYEAYGLLAQGIYPKVSIGCEKRLSMVKSAEAIALTTDNDTLLSRIYNMLGIYATQYERNFSQARHYYGEAIKHARRINATDFIVSAECNIAELYHSIGDTLGHTYDIDIYKYAKSTDNKVLLLAATQRCAEYYIDYIGRPERALPYIESAREAGSDYLYHLLRGKYYLAVDSTSAARDELDAALREEVISPNVYLTYGKLLNRLGDYNESNAMLHKVEEAYREIDSRGFGHVEARRIMADNYRRLGDAQAALYYLELYTNGRDSITRLRNIEEINTQKVRFEVQKKELELARNREIMKRQSITLWAVLIIIVFTASFYLFYRLRQHHLRRLIVRQQKEFLMEQSAVHGETKPVDVIKAHASISEVEPQKGLTSEKAAAIWSLIEYEMDVNKIYTDTTVTRDIFSKRVGCNHSWFTQVIKERTGKSYLQFMNSRRIKEALRVLSDPSSVITQKDLASSLGFLSTSTFYATFRQQVGMSPAEYRKMAIAEGKSPKNATEES